MSTNTYVALDTKTISTAATSVEFIDIPQNYTDLIVVATLSSASDGEGISFQVGNGTIDTNNNYSRTVISGADDNGAASFRQANQSSISLQYAIGIGSNQPSLYQIHFMNYSNTSTIKTFLANSSSFRGTSTNKKEAMRLGGQWRSTSAINRIKFNCTVNINVGSTFTLYGIASSNIVAPKAIGGTITQDSTHTYHTFGATGTFTPQQSLTCDVLVVAGGGGGSAAGAGAGGLLGFASQSLTTTGYTVTVGAGGAGVFNAASQGVNGIDSQFGSLTLVKGGGGGAAGGGNAVSGSNGGSGGGAFMGGAANSGAVASGGSPTSGQGYAGGNSYPQQSSKSSSGGGGGAGAAGGTPSVNDYAGAGGIGLSTYSSWGIVTGTGENVSGTIYYAGGGGGGYYVNGGYLLGGAGGGGSGTSNNSIGTTNGKSLTGGGGGGAYSPTYAQGGNGGSGLVIIRYAN
jgi:hypothetical protein